MEEKLAIASYNTPNELFYQKSEILAGIKKKFGHLVDKMISFFLFCMQIFYTFGWPFHQ